MSDEHGYLTTYALHPMENQGNCLHNSVDVHFLLYRKPRLSDLERFGIRQDYVLASAFSVASTVEQFRASNLLKVLDINWPV